MPSSLSIHVDDLLRFRGVESSRVEFKAGWNEGPVALQVLKTLCAFANDDQNLNGGYVVLGVAAPEGRAELPPAGLDPDGLEKIQKAIRGRCKTLRPEYQPVFSPETVDGKWILVIWAPGSDTRPHQAPDDFQGGHHRYFVRIGGETVEAKGDHLTQLMQQTARVPFDDRRASDVPIEKIRESRVREFLVDERSGLQAESDAREIYRKMRIVDRVNGHEVPRNVGLLYFSDDPEEWFRGARIEVAQFAGDAGGSVIEERIFRGPLAQQLRDCLSHLGNLSTRHLEKKPDRPETVGWVSYPQAAIEEAVVNAVYHRSYDGEPEPTKIHIYPDRMEIVSYPGPVPGIRTEDLHPGTKSRPPVPARNRRIGEYLKELRLAEARYTGIPKIFGAMEENGSPPPSLDFDEARSYFRVTLAAHPESIAIGALKDAAHLRAIGDEKAAIRRLENALVAQPDSEAIALELIEALSRSGASRVLDGVAPRLSPRQFTRVAAAVAKAYARTERWNEFLEVLDHLRPPLGEEFEDLMDVARAQIEVAKAASGSMMRRPDAPSPRIHEAIQRLREEAVTRLERAVRRPAEPLRLAHAWVHLGTTQKLLARPPRETWTRSFEEAARLAPDDRWVREAIRRASE